MPKLLDSSRYHQNQNIIDEDIYELSRVMNTSYSYTYVRNEEKDRLDLVAYRVYRNSLLWWVIARFNGIYNPYNLPARTQLRIPDISSRGLDS